MASTASVNNQLPPAPVVSVKDALDDLGVKMEQLGALMTTNVDDMGDLLANRLQRPNDYDWAQRIWTIFTIAQERLQETERLVAAITVAVFADWRDARSATRAVGQGE